MSDKIESSLIKVLAAIVTVKSLNITEILSINCLVKELNREVYAEVLMLWMIHLEQVIERETDPAIIKILKYSISEYFLLTPNDTRSQIQKSLEYRVFENPLKYDTHTIPDTEPYDVEDPYISRYQAQFGNPCAPRKTKR